MKSVHFLMIAVITLTAVPTYSQPVSKNTTSIIYFNELAKKCSNNVHPDTLQAIARVESGFNPYAIGVVKGQLSRQPRTLDEAISIAKDLHNQGKNFSMGLMQVNRHNLKSYGLTYETVFDPCTNVNVGAQILKSCFDRAGGNGQLALQKAFSCYYSGNFKFGFRSDFKGQPSYVNKVIMAAMNNSPRQTVKFSGSLNNLQQSSLMKTSYVPQPSTQTVVDSTISQQAEQTSDSTYKETPNTITLPKHEWDIFQEF